MLTSQPPSTHPGSTQIRKAYWDPVFDENLVESSVASNLVYLQAVEDVKLKHLDYNEVQFDLLNRQLTAGTRKTRTSTASTSCAICLSFHTSSWLIK